MSDTSASSSVCAPRGAGDGARRVPGAGPPGVRAPGVGPVVVLARRTRGQRGVSRRRPAILHAVCREGELRGSVRCQRHPAARLSGPHRTAVQPDCRRPLRSGAIQPLVRRRRQPRPHGLARRVPVARRQPAVERPACAGVGPPLRLAVPAGAEGAVVFRARTGQRRVDARQGGDRDRRRRVRRGRASRLPVARAADRARRCARDRHARRRLDRGIHRRPAEPHSERVHLGALGRLRLRALEPPAERVGAVGRLCQRRSRHGWTISTPVGGPCTRPRPRGTRCSPASTITGFTRCSFASSTN